MTRNFIHSLNDGTDWRTDGHTKGSRIGFFFLLLWSHFTASLKNSSILIKNVYNQKKREKKSKHLKKKYPSKGFVAIANFWYLTFACGFCSHLSIVANGHGELKFFWHQLNGFTPRRNFYNYLHTSWNLLNYSLTLAIEYYLCLCRSAACWFMRMKGPDPGLPRSSSQA